VSSDRGLCGAYNANILRKAMEQVRALRNAGREITLEVSGKKAVGFFKFSRIPLAQRHTIGDKPKYDDVERLAQRYMDDFSAGKYDAVRIAYMRFESNARQIPEVVQLLPLKPPTNTSATPASGQQPAVSGQPSAQNKQPTATYEFSPSAEGLLADLLPLSVKSTLFQAFNDAVVSEQIMRMVAMKAATENAKDLGKTLKRQYNRARQSKITTELTEIVSGAAALE
jgi:F-type H+-transporting ATPase subunit gamma